MRQAVFYRWKGTDQLCMSLNLALIRRFKHVGGSIKRRPLLKEWEKESFFFCSLFFGVIDEAGN